MYVKKIHGYTITLKNKLYGTTYIFLQDFLQILTNKKAY